MAVEFTNEEIDNIIDQFKAMGVKPKADTPEDLKQWMKQLLENSGELAKVKHEKVETEVKVGQIPKIPLFSGDPFCPKNETTFVQWRYHVRCLLRENNFTKAAIGQGIRNSLKGEAAGIVRRLGPESDLNQMLSKLQSVYGSVAEAEELLADFYAAKQGEKESISEWGCKLEELLDMAVEEGAVLHSDVNDKLVKMFRKGMKPSIRDICGHLFEKHTDFDQLRRAVRKIEDEHKDIKLKPLPSKMATASNHESKNDIKELKEMMEKISSEVACLKSEVQWSSCQSQPLQFQQQHQPSRMQYHQNTQRQDGYRPQRQTQYQPQRQTQYQPQTQHQQESTGEEYAERGGRQNRFYNRGRGRGRYQSHGGSDGNFNQDPVCYRCGQVGHLKYGCRVRLDFLRKDLNGGKPIGRGHQ